MHRRGDVIREESCEVGPRLYELLEENIEGQNRLIRAAAAGLPRRDPFVKKMSGNITDRAAAQTEFAGMTQKLHAGSPRQIP